MTIALVEDDDAVLRSLAMLLQRRGLSVRCYSSAEEFLSSDGEPPECVVTDIRMPGISGLELQRQLKRSDPTIPVILITGHGDIAMAVQAIKEGAFDFIEKPLDDARLAELISRAVSTGQKLRTEKTERAELQARKAELSPRQIEVMHLVADGLSNKEIAHKLSISPRTVEHYRAWVMEKMGAGSLADLIRKVIALDK